MRFAILIVLCALLGSGAVSAQNLTWGPHGHSVVAGIAQTYLTAHAQNMTKYLLAAVDGDMSKVASWADEVRNRMPWSAVLHFVDTPDWLCQYEYNRDCLDHDTGEANRCADGAIQNYTARVADTKLPLSERTDSLKFLIHFVGDIHQPLHTSFLGDRGGNDIKGHYLGKKVNLHQMWDTTLIKTRLEEFDGQDLKWQEFLMNKLKNEWKPLVPIWMSCPDSSFAVCSTKWTVDSLDKACKNGYVDVDGSRMQSGFTVGMPYYAHNMPVIEEQVAKGGVRLAAILNAIWP